MRICSCSISGFKKDHCSQFCFWEANGESGKNPAARSLSNELGLKFRQLMCNHRVIVRKSHGLPAEKEKRPVLLYLFRAISECPGNIHILPSSLKNETHVENIDCIHIIYANRWIGNLRCAACHKGN